MDDDIKLKVEELCQEILTKFSSEFINCFTESLIDKVKFGVNNVQIDTKCENEFKLQKSPIPKEPLKIGLLTKQGGWFKSWKTRHFVMYNEIDNFKIEYFDRAGGQLKGTIYPCGYKVEVLNEDENRIMGQYGFKLSCKANRRIWYFLSGSNEDRNHWIQVLKYCCYKSRPERNSDSVIANAFVKALRRVCIWYRIRMNELQNASELEQLSELCMTIIDRELLSEYEKKISSGISKSQQVSAIRSAIDSTVQSMSTSSWNGATASVTSLCTSLQNTIMQLINPLIEKEVEVKEKIRGLVARVTNSVFEDKTRCVLHPLLIKLVFPVSKSFERFIRDFSEKVRSLILNFEFSSQKFDETVTNLKIQWYWILLEGSNIINEFCTQTLPSLISELAINTISPESIFLINIDLMYQLFNNAVYSFELLSRDKDPDSQSTIFTEIMKKLVHDAKVSVKMLIISLLRNAIDTSVQELIIPSAELIVEPIQNVLNSMPVLGLSSLFNLPTLTASCVDDILLNSLDAVISSGYLEASFSDFDSIRV